MYSSGDDQRCGIQGLELSERTPAVCEATVWLLEQQNEDGYIIQPIVLLVPECWHRSWPARWHPEDAKCFYGVIYDTLHPAWVASFALCDRKPNCLGAKGWSRFIRPILEKVCFHIDPRSTFVNPVTSRMIGFR